tara:strand:+ start:388 stop:924 length:537 start_codon:yes stop_codon:yes gene_type:complete
MGAGEASTGGNGGVGPAGRKKDGTYGTKKDAKKTSSRNEFRTFVKKGGVTGAIVRGITKSVKKSKAKKQANVEVGLGKDRMSNYTVGQGGTRETGSNDNNNQPTKPIQPPKPVIVKKNIGGTEIQTTEAKLTEEKKKTDDDEYDARRTKRRGRRMTILTSKTGLGENLVLGKPTLLGS